MQATNNNTNNNNHNNNMEQQQLATMNKSFYGMNIYTRMILFQKS